MVEGRIGDGERGGREHMGSGGVRSGGLGEGGDREGGVEERRGEVGREGRGIVYISCMFSCFGQSGLCRCPDDF